MTQGAAGQSHDRRMSRASLIGLGGVALIGLNAASEVAFTPTPWTEGAIVGVLGAATLFGFFAPALLSLVGDAVRSRSDAFRRAAFWSPALAGIGIGFATGAAGGFVSSATAVIGVAVAGLAAATAQRFLPTLAAPADGYLAPFLLVWVFLSSVCVATLADVARPVTELMIGVPMLCGVGAALLQVFARVLDGWTTRRLVALVLAGGLTGAGVVLYLASWLPSLNSRLKLLVTATVIVSIIAVAEPILSRLRPTSYRRFWAAAGVLAVTHLVLSMTATIPQRFGGLGVRTTAGLAVALPSLLDDRDGDGFYDADAGGNDCDDDDARRNPFAESPENTCLPKPLRPETTRTSIEHDGDVIVVIIDALRADLLATKAGRQPFGALSAIASESVRFTTAYSPGNSTFTSIPSMLTGLGPNRVMNAVIEGRYQTLVSGAWWFDAADDDVCRAMIAQSHDAAAWLFPYYPRELDVRVMDARVNEVLHSSGRLPTSMGTVLEKCGDRRMALVLYADDPHLQIGQGHACAGGGFGGYNCYLDEVRAVDRGLTEVIDMLRDAGRWDDAAVLLTADHGEAFGERGHVGHTSNVFEEQVRVPLWLRVPDVEPGEVERPVSGLSVAPTAIDLLGETPPPRFYPSLLALAEGQDDAWYPSPIAENSTGRMKKAWTSPQTAMRVGDQKLIYDWRTARPVLFNLAGDPDEERPVESHERIPELTEQLLRTERALLTGWQPR